LRGGEEITATSLTRFFGFHVAILPGDITLLVALHLWLIARRGVSLPMSIEGSPVKMVAYYPHIALRDQARGVALALVVVSLAEWLPRELGSRADPFVSAPTDARPAWYFLWVFEIIRSLPPRIAGLDGDKVAVSVLMGALATFFALPLLDRKGSKVVFYLGWAAVVCLVGATIHGLR
jgi:quinol-cytochrome oxidoreductase complex cytochrome b subunit